jgi:lipopolysaccharide transport system ATP-binding protein
VLLKKVIKLSNTVISVENLGKQYRLGNIGTGTISHDLNRWWARVRGKEDPSLMLGETNDRTIKGNSDFVWALRDVSFNVEKGDMLGIIGKNGAGKSTLLKILSRTTTPTTGSFKSKGKVASLLEVGTGFHPELTGRENVYLNGAILGMTKAEIKQKFDEIVDFSGVERYIDTPVKRYSSGMQVRLAFAVAANLDSDILIVDEVLAVGDQEFQDKCIGKMKNISSGEGKTVLFVSHNIGAIKSLCNKGLLIHNGNVLNHGEIGKIISQYQTLSYQSNSDISIENRKDRKGNGAIVLSHLSLSSGIQENISSISAGQKSIFKMQVKKIQQDFNLSFYAALIIKNGNGDRMFTISSDFYRKKLVLNSENSFEFEMDKMPLSIGKYTVDAYIWNDGDVIDDIESVFEFTVTDNDFFNLGVKQGANIDLFFNDFTIRN